MIFLIRIKNFVQIFTQKFHSFNLFEKKNKNAQFQLDKYQGRNCGKSFVRIGPKRHLIKDIHDINID